MIKPNKRSHRLAMPWENLSTFIGSNYETKLYQSMTANIRSWYRHCQLSINDAWWWIKVLYQEWQKVKWCLSAFMKFEKVFGLSELRHNLYNSSEVSGGPAHGFSSGTAMDDWYSQDTAKGLFWMVWYLLDESIRRTIRRFYFIISLIFVLSLVLSAQWGFVLYFDYPFAPIFGLFLWWWRVSETIFMPESRWSCWLVYSARMPVLIVEFAAQRHAMGQSALKPRVEGRRQIKTHPDESLFLHFIVGFCHLFLLPDPEPLAIEQ